MERKYSWEQETSRGTKIVLWTLTFLLVGVIIIGFAKGWFETYGNKEGISPEVLLQKYEWCQKASFVLDKRKVRIDWLMAQQAEVERANAKKPESKWSTKTKRWYHALLSEITDAKASHDSIAVRYNTEMEELQGRFTKNDSLPPGITAPLKRTYPLFQR